ncbi:hypothetical protein LguiB_022940 [Lonicera macranthoides]
MVCRRKQFYNATTHHVSWVDLYTHSLSKIPLFPLGSAISSVDEGGGRVSGGVGGVDEGSGRRRERK